MPSVTTHTCTRCGHTHPADADNFYIYPNGRFGYCRQCCRDRAAAQNAARRGQPRSGGRQFGIELEFVGSITEVVRQMQAQGLSCDYLGYTHRVTPGAWKVVTDSSVMSGGELVSPPLKGAEGRRQVRKACAALQAAGARITRECGLHVHHDVNDLDHRAFGRFFRFWMDAQRATNTLVAASRRQDHWACQPLTGWDVQQIEELPRLDRHTVNSRLSVSRYRTLNVQSYPRYGTVEVRQHQGTMNAKKIIAWVEYAQAMIKWAKGQDATPTHDRSSRDQVMSLLRNYGLKATTVDYLNQRAAALSRMPVAPQVA
jgi:hypothetical protein